MTVRNKSRARKSRGSFRTGVLLLRGAQRHDQLPAHVVDRRGRGRGQRDLPQDRVPRAAEPLCPLRLHAPVAGFDTDRDAFVGVHEGLHEARVPFAGKCTGSKAFGWNPIGAHQVDLDLGPGAEESFAFVLAYVEQGDLPKFDAPVRDQQELGRAIARQLLRSPGPWTRPSRTLGTFWDGLLSNFQAELPDEHAARMLNAWNQYQCMATFNLSRSTSMYETGIGRGMGFRDSNQDILGFVHMIPARARAAHPRHRRDPALRRHLLPPVPAAHEEGQRRDRRRLLRRPPLARALDVRLRQGNRRPRHPARSRSATRDQCRGRHATALFCTISRLSHRATRCATAARTGCR